MADLTTNILVFSTTNTITTRGGTLQMYGMVLPTTASPIIYWDVINVYGEATIGIYDGLLTAVSNGTVVVVANSQDGSLVTGYGIVTISGQEILPASITILSVDGEVSIDIDNGTLQLFADVQPIDTEDKSVTWSVSGILLNGHPSATISATGLLTAVLSDMVMVTATSDMAPTVFGSKLITISNQKKVTSVVVSDAPGETLIAPGSTLQMEATITPIDAVDPTVTWSVIDGTGEATIDSSGLLTAVSSGLVEVLATANDSIGVSGSTMITIASITIAPAGWHVPSEAEWVTLATFLGGNSVAAGPLKEAGYIHWDSPNTGATNSSGFTGVGAGLRTNAGIFNSRNYIEAYWLTDEYYSKSLYADRVNIITTIEPSGKYGYSLRLIKDSTDLVDGETSFVTDIDGNNYITVCIGTQEWTASNLNVHKMNDGTPIPEVIPNEEWAGMTSPAWCYYGDNITTTLAPTTTIAPTTTVAPTTTLTPTTTLAPTTTIAPTTTLIPNPYGAFYNWYAATYNTGGASIAPAGWHIPSIAEVTTLILNWDSEITRGNALTLDDLAFWDTFHDATNSSGFSAVGSGIRSGVDGDFQYVNKVSRIVVSNNPGGSACGALFVDNRTTDMLAAIGTDIYNKDDGFSIRLIKDNATNSGTVVDIDGNSYQTVKIADQVWMASNLTVEHYNDGTPITM
jgi:uncharacterized protein (TIGR02145 family)